jgi:cation:H+ antiporter
MAGLFLLSIDILAYLLARNGTIGRVEGGIFVLILSLYFIIIIKKRRVSTGGQQNQRQEEEKAHSRSQKISLLKKPVFLFIAGSCGVILASRAVIWASISIARHFSLSETLIGLTIIAIGTSLPEISTCITAARKGEGEIAVGDIIGADILNILWIIGVSSIVNPIQVDLEVINFSFPFMILIVVVMLVSMRLGCRLTKLKGVLLLGLY